MDKAFSATRQQQRKVGEGGDVALGSRKAGELASRNGKMNSLCCGRSKP